MGTGRRGRGGERGHKQYTVANVALALKWHYEWVMRETSNATMEAVNKDAAAHGVHVPVCVCVCVRLFTHTHICMRVRRLNSLWIGSRVSASRCSRKWRKTGAILSFQIEWRRSIRGGREAAEEEIKNSSRNERNFELNSMWKIASNLSTSWK